MFTGLIEEVGLVRQATRKGMTLKVSIMGNIVLEDLKIGDSIAINGVCQTVTSIIGNTFSVEISSTTLEKTTLAELQKIQYVNMERAMKLNGRIGGHLVQGHVNHRAEIISISKNQSMILLKVSLSHDSMKYIIDEGSIAIDGISLTVSEKHTGQNSISMRIIPHTFQNTNLIYKKAGDKVNIETDMIGRYCGTLLRNDNQSRISAEKIKMWGY